MRMWPNWSKTAKTFKHMNTSFTNRRRGFLKQAALFAAGTFSMVGLTPPSKAMAGEVHEAPKAGGNTIIGPREGYSPQIGTLVSMMAFMRDQVLNSVKGMTTEQLDFLLDDKANRIGAMLNHLAATDAFYHEHTFKGVEWGKFDPAVSQKFEVAMELGEPARKAIKGNNLDYYLNLLSETREATLAEFRKRDDQWLMTVDEKWPWGPTNNYCKWFHVCEHEANHNGQIKLLKSRLPGAKAGE
jgi:Protein of unknown function (DUF664)